MSNTYQAGLSFEKAFPGTYRIRNTKGRILGFIRKYASRYHDTYWRIDAFEMIGLDSKYKSFTDAKNALRDPAYQDFHLAE